ncbi:hypothetical protein ABIA32_001392 [Streptacidiphilus sp. MAP12-20]|uniref:SWIM zinc finger family protein n=1 Tax=Streptacidiphilus sp. MAP12-20 TaxID=3156299 RepID=UPI003516B00D
MDVRWTTDHVLSLSPDAASAKAAAKLAKAEPWSGTGASAEAVWGACKGSGSRPYQTVVALDGPAYHCSCPSRKFPCKHALALLLLWSAEALAGEASPEWADSWLTGRRQRAERAAADPTDPASTIVPPRDDAAAAARRRRRETRVAAGAAELQARLTDQLRGGLADAPTRGHAFWEGVAARMVDAQAPGLAARARELGSLPASGGPWPSRLVEEYGLLHLLTAGYRRVDALPGPLAATVRARVGFTVDNADVLANGRLIRDRWLVLGSRDSADDRLTTRRLWLRGAESGRLALLLSFGRPGVAPELSLPIGLELDADLAFHAAARPLRAALGPRYAAPASPAAARPIGVTLDAALAEYARALGEDPWLDAWPTVVSGVTPVPTESGWQLVDATGAVPLRTASLWRLVAASGGRPVTLFGECGHRGFSAVTCWTDAGSLSL